MKFFQYLAQQNQKLLGYSYCSLDNVSETPAEVSYPTTLVLLLARAKTIPRDFTVFGR